MPQLIFTKFLMSFTGEKNLVDRCIAFIKESSKRDLHIRFVFFFVSF